MVGSYDPIVQIVFFSEWRRVIYQTTRIFIVNAVRMSKPGHTARVFRKDKWKEIYINISFTKLFG
jgi:hypothetical protein